jgi:AGZA family xanthine/uracil permease-like MFS transporter
LGVIHAYALTPQGVQNHFGLNAAPQFALAYLASALLLWIFHQRERRLMAAPDRTPGSLES